MMGQVEGYSAEARTKSSRRRCFAATPSPAVSHEATRSSPFRRVKPERTRMFPPRMLVRLAPLILAGLVGWGLSAAGGPAVAASKCNAAERTALNVAVTVFDTVTSAYHAAGAVAGEAKQRYASAKEAYRSASEIAKFLKRTVSNTSAAISKVGRTGSAPTLTELKRALRSAQAQLLEQLNIVQYSAGNLQVLLAASRTADSAFSLKAKQVESARKALDKLSTKCGATPRPSSSSTVTPRPTPTSDAGAWTGAFCRLYRDYDANFQTHLSYSTGDEGITTGGEYTQQAYAQVEAMAPYARTATQRDWADYASRFYSMVVSADPIGWSAGWPDDSTLDWYSLGWTSNPDFTIAAPAEELLTRQDAMSQCLTSVLSPVSPAEDATKIVDAWTGPFCTQYKTYYKFYTEHMDFNTGDEGPTTDGGQTQAALALVKPLKMLAVNSEQRDWADYAKRFYQSVLSGQPTRWSGGWPDNESLNWQALGWTQDRNYEPNQPFIELAAKQASMAACLKLK